MPNSGNHDRNHAVQTRKHTAGTSQAETVLCSGTQHAYCTMHPLLLAQPVTAQTHSRAPVRAARSTKRKPIHRCATELNLCTAQPPRRRHSQAPAEHTVADHLPASCNCLLLVACELPTLLQLVPLHLQLAFPLHTVCPHAFLSRSLVVINSLLLYWSHCR